MNRSCLFVFKTGLLTALIGATGLVAAQTLPYRSGVEYFYQIESGDTPASIKTDLLRPDITWKHVAQLNNLPADKSDISDLTQLRMPVTWINRGEKYARVEAKTGDVKVNGSTASKGSVLTEKGTIETGESGVVVILLPDGTEMTIAPSSKVRIDRLRQYFDGESIEARLRLERGEINSFTPHSGNGKLDKKRRDKRDIRIRTPKATAAVRGTQFRVGTSDELSASGVLAGLVDWSDSDGKSSSSLKKGFGAAFSKTGKPSGTESLLPAPRVLAPAGVLNKTSVTIPFEPVDGADRYEVKIASNTAFKDVIRQYTTTDTKVTFDSLRDGNHYVAVRALSPTGVEGYDGVAKVSFLARPFAPKLDQPANQDFRKFADTTLRWKPVKDATQYRVQLASDSQFKNILLDEKVLTPEFTYRPDVSKPRPLRRFWRVASMQDWTTGPFTDVRSFDLATNGPIPTMRVDNENTTVTVSWAPQPGAIGYIVNLEPVSPMTPSVDPLTVTSATTDLSSYEPGQYKVTVIARYADKVQSLESAPTLVTIDPIVVKLTTERSPGKYYGAGGELDLNVDGKVIQ
jgi:hypothetical protein